MREMKDSGVEWIGEIPKNWKLKRMKYFCDERVESSYYNKNLDTYIGLENIESYADDLIETSSEYPEKVYDFCHDGDVLFGKLRPYLAKCIIAPFSANCTGELLVLYSKENNHRFIRYWLLSDGFLKKVDSSTYGAKMPRANSTYILNLPVPDVSVMEQAAIVSYLDRHCAAIDRTIKATKASIDKLKEYKRAIIARAVTKGLNPDAEMKDSGVEWIGEIPAHWNTVKAKYVVIISHGSDPKKKGDIPVYGSGAESFKTCGEYKEGPAVLLGRKGATLHIPHFVEGKYWNVDTAFDAKPEIFPISYNLRYYYYCANCFDYKKYISQTTLPSMTQTDYANMKLPWPDISEQQLIVEHIENECTAIDNLIAKKQQFIDKFTEYRESLIYAAVTGKIDCREEETA